MPDVKTLNGCIDSSVQTLNERLNKILEAWGEETNDNKLRFKNLSKFFFSDQPACLNNVGLPPVFIVNISLKSTSKKMREILT